jgi:hypothetical protein
MGDNKNNNHKNTYAPAHTLKACGRMATKFYTFLNFGTGCGEWSALGPVRLISGKKKRVKIGEVPA